MLKEKKFIVIIILIFVVVSGVTYLMWDIVDLNKDRKQNGKQKSEISTNLKRSQNAKQFQEQNLSQLIEKKKEQFEDKLRETEYELQSELGLKTHLILKTYYKKCGDVVTEEKLVNKQLGVEELLTKYPNWQMTQKSRYRIILSKEIDDVCPEHKERMYLGIKKGFVAIFYGRPGAGKKILKRKTNISTDPLPEKEINNLKEGIEVNSQKELLTLLEGLSSVHDERIE